MAFRLPIALVVAAAALIAPAAANATRVSFAMGEELASGVSPLANPPASLYYTDTRWKFGSDANESAVMDLLRDRDATVTYHLRYGRDFGPVPAGLPAPGNQPDALPSLRKLEARGIPWSAWLTVPYADGYWATEANGSQTRAAVVAFHEWAVANGLHPIAVSLDLEASAADTKTFGRAFRDPLRAATTMLGNLSPRRQCAAARFYRDEVVGWLKQRGYAVVAAAYPYVLDDLRDRDLALSDAMNLPLAFPGEFDTIGFMSMRTVFTEGGLPDPGRTLQSSYGADATRYYGPDAELILGVPGVGPYGGPNGRNALRQDIRTAAAVTRGGIGLYSVETVYRAYGGLDAVGEMLDAGEDPLPGAATARTAPAAQLARGAFQALDAVLGGFTRPNRWPPAC
ncbi:MAG: hypothetical protein JHC95_03000 [Solirubrobacteraceae bacterium]|nr:hypothetical protein [Solirubrobacteraceae bacterium]